MRRLIVAAMVAASVQGAQAADLPDWGDLPVLRGGVGYGRTSDWQGFYVGGQAGYGSSDMNFSESNSALIGRALGPNNILYDTVVSVSQANGKVNSHQTAFGGFVGYNSQWEDVVIGLEANYMHGKFNGTSNAAPVPLTYVTPFSDGRYHTIGLNSSRGVSVTDIGTIRARAGYTIGSFLPYVFGGVALGRADITSTVYITDRSDTTFAGSPSGPLRAYSASDSTGGKMLYGYTAGLGTEAMLFGNVFARAEWEYIRFVNAGADVNINTVRGGVGYRF
jgi:opacity protein-like surface antigen